MTGLVLGEVVLALDNPEPSATKLGRAYGEHLAANPDLATVPEKDEAQQVAVAGVDASVLAAKYGPERAYAPRWMTGSFRVPYGMREAQLVTLCRDMATRWFEDMAKRGFDLVGSVSPQVNPGPNPSRDLQTGLVIPGYRDFLIQAQFTQRHPETIRIELDPTMTDDWAPHQLPKSPGEED